MDEEMRAHIAMRVDELRLLGLSPGDAEAEALRRFGDADAFRDYTAARAGQRARRLAAVQWFADGAQDLRVALRQFRQVPALAGVVMLTLACCIGATTAAYGVVRHLLLAPLPFADGHRIVSLEARNLGDGEFHFNNLNAELVTHWAARSRTVQDLAALEFVHKRPPVGAGRAGAQDTVPAVARVTPSFLLMLRVRPLLGRGFTLEDARPGAPAVALLGEELWRSRYGGEPGVIGRAITLGRVPYTIVGVLPRSVTVPTQTREPLDVLLPLDIQSAPPAAMITDAFARLGPGVNSAAATRELEAILRTLPDTVRWRELHATVLTPSEQLDPRRRRAVEVLFAAAGGLLLIACADVAGLLLMRGWARRREFAIRRALGASRGRLARQLLTESLLLAVPGGALGLLIAWLGLRAAVAVRPWTLGFLDSLRLDGATFLWTAAISVTTALLFGIGPALIAGRQPLDGALRTGGEGAGRSTAARRAHAALVVGQIALSLMFLSAAGVLGRSFVSLARTPVGYEPAGLFEVSVHGGTPTRDVSLARSAGAGDAVLRAVREALAATPEVREVAVGTLPLTKIGGGVTAVEGPSGVRPVDIPATVETYVGSDYFRVTRIPLVRGRGFDGSPATATGEVVINQALARRLWRDHDALGARLRLGDGPDALWLTVVGVVGDARMPGSAAELFGLQMYRPSSAAEEFVGSLVLRARGDTAALRRVLARAVERAGVGVTLGEVVPAEWTLEFAFGGPRFAVALFGAFAALAVALAAVGLFGIVAYAVARRTREIAVRMALGADPAALTRTILGQSVRLLVLGLGIGLLGAYGASRALTALVYDVSPTDPVTVGGAVVLLLAISLAASALPLRRALRVNPADTLRAE
jgi:putative ABC transport system permease protein